MDISKYLTNKDIQLSNDDIDIEKLEKAIRKGYVLESEKDNAVNEAITNSSKESTSKYTELENKYNELEKSYNALEERNASMTSSNNDLRLQVEIVSQGFSKEQVKEIAQLRNSLYAEEKDDTKAIGLIKDKFGATYFPKADIEIPNEASVSNTTTEAHPIKVTRNTAIKDIAR